MLCNQNACLILRISFCTFHVAIPANSSSQRSLYKHSVRTKRSKEEGLLVPCEVLETTNQSIGTGTSQRPFTGCGGIPYLFDQVTNLSPKTVHMIQNSSNLLNCALKFLFFILNGLVPLTDQFVPFKFPFLIVHNLST